jgi:hypothetical protein
MDGQITSYIDTNNQEIIDFNVLADGTIPIITGETEQEQNAQLSSFIQRDSIPQLVGNGIGVDWSGFLTKGLSFGEIDAQIRDNLNYTGLSSLYYPFYSIVNNKLTADIRKVGT